MAIMESLSFNLLARYRRLGFAWLKSASGLLALLILSMVITVLAGFMLLSSQQRALDEVRDHARQMRLARQAMMEMDTSFLHAVVQRSDKFNVTDFERAYDRVMGHPASSFPTSVMNDGETLSGTDAISQLVERINVAVDQVRAGRWDEAARLYISGDVSRRIGQIVRSYSLELDQVEATYAAQRSANVFASLCLVILQVLSGLLSVAAFLYAIRQSKREAKARTIAVVSANETRDQVERLFEMADMLQSATDYTDANAVLRSAASELLFGFSGALYVFNNSRDRLILSTTWDRDGFEPPPESLGLNQCWALKRGKAHINRPYSRKLCCEHHSGSDYALEIPMTARGEILGLLQVYAEGDHAEERLLKAQGLAVAIADAMSLALANIALREKLRSQALRDPLTGLYNRRYMEDTLQRFVRLAEREGREFSVVMIDLDHFKRLNDQHGHAKGDAVLRDAAAAILSQIRESDVACRYGGEELIVLLPECGLDMAAGKAENIRLSIEALSEPNGAQVSASIGVAAIPTTSLNAKDLVATADAALYRAKQGGRNRVERAPLRKNNATLKPPGRRKPAEGDDADTPLLAAE